MSEVAVTYEGPAGVYRAEDPESGEWVALARASGPTKVSRKLAEKLSKADGHDFTIDGKPTGEQAAAPSDSGGAPKVGDQSGVEIKKGPPGVNAPKAGGS